jgi:hypothetical protein
MADSPGEPQYFLKVAPMMNPTWLPYEVILVEKAAMPTGTEGDDWYRYVLSSGGSPITGFHRGSLAEVKEYAAHCVEELNLRSIHGKSARTVIPLKKKK